MLLVTVVPLGLFLSFLHELITLTKPIVINKPAENNLLLMCLILIYNDVYSKYNNYKSEIAIKIWFYLLDTMI